jgi:uncharacterized membrane protein YqjE
MTLDGRDGRRTIVALLRDVGEGSATLVRNEARLAKMEIAEIGRAAAQGTAFVATGAVMALIGVLSLLAGLVMLIGDQWLPADRYWLSALIVLVITGAMAAWLARRGLMLVSPSQLAPHETVTTLKEDTEWLKQQLTSDATSN